MRVRQVMVLLVAVVVMFVGCASSPKPEMVQVKITSADFESDAGGKLIINNHTGNELAIFAGRVELGNYLGAIGTGAGGHSRSKTIDLEGRVTGLPEMGAFLIRATTFTEINKKGLAGITEEDVVYTGLITFDKNNPDKIEHNIYQGIDTQKETFITVTNRSNFALELRLDSATGEKVAVLSPGQRYKRIYLQPDPSGFPRLFFPTYVYVDTRTGELNAFTDEVNLNGQRFEPEPLGTNQREIVFNGPTSGGPRFNVAFINLQNDTNSLLNFMTAEGNYVRNDRGSLNTNPGRADNYQITTGEEGTIYTAAGVQSDDGFHPVGTLQVNPGHRYQLVITTLNGRVQSALRDLGPRGVDELVRFDLFGEFAN